MRRPSKTQGGREATTVQPERLPGKAALFPPSVDLGFRPRYRLHGVQAGRELAGEAL